MLWNQMLFTNVKTSKIINLIEESTISINMSDW